MSDCLLLNSNYEPISILPLSVIGWQHALKLYFLDRVTILESYEDWVIRSEYLAINVPSVLVTKEYFDNKKHVKFSRANMYLRDLYQCQYCGDTFNGDDLTIDHVLPRASGGKTNWDNCTTACKACNFKKGHKLMVQIQSSWFPLFDRNPQQFVNIYTCADKDFVPCEIGIYHSAEQPSYISLPVLKP